MRKLDVTICATQSKEMRHDIFSFASGSGSIMFVWAGRAGTFWWGFFCLRKIFGIWYLYFLIFSVKF